MNQQYETDFYSWAFNQADLLKHKRIESLDIEHLVEEIECLGRSQERALRSFLKNLYCHLLKDEYQQIMKTRSWDFTIDESLRQVKRILKENPGLKSKLLEIDLDAYLSGRCDAALQTGMEESIFPEDCPWNIEDILKEEI